MREGPTFSLELLDFRTVFRSGSDSRARHFSVKDVQDFESNACFLLIEGKPIADLVARVHKVPVLPDGVRQLLDACADQVKLHSHVYEICQLPPTQVGLAGCCARASGIPLALPQEIEEDCLNRATRKNDH